MDELGYDHVWTWDHLYAIIGDPYQPVFEGYATLAAWAKVTSRARLGLFVGANTFRNPGLVAKALTTLDHLSGGRVIAGLGAAWHELEHEAYGIEFGASARSAPRLARGVRRGRPRAARGRDGHVAARRPLRLPRPAAAPAAGPAARADHDRRLAARRRRSGSSPPTPTCGTPAGRPRSSPTSSTCCGEHCAAVGRDPAEIELTVGCKPLIRDSRAEARRAWSEHHGPQPDLGRAWTTTRRRGSARPSDVAEAMRERTALGFRTFIAELAAPYDPETMERWIDRGPTAGRGAVAALTRV